jgi:hypothetical protein
MLVYNLQSQLIPGPGFVESEACYPYLTCCNLIGGLLIHKALSPGPGSPD